MPHFVVSLSLTGTPVELTLDSAFCMLVELTGCVRQAGRSLCI